MDNIARYDRLQRIVAEAAQYRTLREVVRSDPQIAPHTARAGPFSLVKAMMDIKGDTIVVLSPTDRLCLLGNPSWQ